MNENVETLTLYRDEFLSDIVLSASVEKTFNEEMFRVIIHGVLHLCGFNDKTKEEKSLIRSKENDFLSSINWKTRL